MFWVAFYKRKQQEGGPKPNANLGCETFALLHGSKLEKESENEFPGPLGPGAQKVENGVQKESKSTVFQLC